MKTMSTQAVLVVAQEAAREAGAIIRHYFRHDAGVRQKAASAELVTEADLSAERTIVDLIRRSFPTHAILAEEEHAGQADAEHVWVIDPLDGTNNFAHGIPHFAVSIGYWEHGQPVVGVIHQPLTDDWYVAVKGQGASHNGRPVRVGTQNQLNEVIIGVGFYYDRGRIMEQTLLAIRDLFYQQIHGVRRFGAASLDLCAVGMGQFGAFFEYQLSPWDFAAGQLFVEEAGGKVTNCLGESAGLRKGSLLASNGKLHEAVLPIVRQHFPHPDLGR